MGIINVTPDSFSDGGRLPDTDAAVAHGLKLVRDGAEVLDIGGESTRPRAVPVPQEEELRRVIPVIERLAGEVEVPISIDTLKPAVAAAALRAGASIINDVGANREDDLMWRLAAESGAGYVCMHMQGTPATMQDNPAYSDVVREVREYFSGRLRRLSDCGVTPEQVMLDVGIGFGKTAEHNLQLLGALPGFGEFRRPLLIGVSRKTFISNFSSDAMMSRVPGSLACACLAVEAGVQLIRVHDVAETVQAVRLTEAVKARRP